MHINKSNGYYSGNDELMDRMNNDYSKFSDNQLVREYEFEMEMMKMGDARPAADPFDIFLKGKGLEVWDHTHDKIDAVRKEIKKRGLPVDISIHGKETDRGMVVRIAENIMELYQIHSRSSLNDSERELYREKILRKITDRYPELINERQTILLSSLIGEELKAIAPDLIKRGHDARLFVEKDIVMICSESIPCFYKRIYADENYLEDKIGDLRIGGKYDIPGRADDVRRDIRKALIEYYSKEYPVDKLKEDNEEEELMP